MTLEELVTRCRELRATESGPEPYAEVVETFVRRRAAGPAPARTVFESLYRGPDLTIQHISLPPGVESPPHDHRMWAVVGIYAGEETNLLFRASGAGLECYDTRSVRCGETITMEPDAVHAIANRTAGYLGAVHVYGGDLFATERTVWRGGEPAPYDEQMFRVAADALAAAEDEHGRPLTADDVAHVMGRLADLAQR